MFLLPMVILVCGCMWYRPSVRVMCPNHEVVVFQPQTVSTLDLCSVSNITAILALPSHLFQPCSGYSFSPLPGPISYLSTIFHTFTPSIFLFVLASHPPYCPGTELLSTWMAPPTTGFHYSYALTSDSRRPKDSLAQACGCLPFYGCPPLCHP